MEQKLKRVAILPSEPELPHSPIENREKREKAWVDVPIKTVIGGLSAGAVVT